MTSVIRLAASAVLAAGGLVLLPATSQAAACESGGVTVVVDYSRSGGSGTETTCVVAGGGDTASELFGAAGHELTRVQRQPGAVCKVDGLRTQDACVNMPPADAFWGLFWSDGDGGWVFSQEGVDSLNVPEGGSVAWAWQNGGGYDYPGTPPASQPQQPDDGTGSTPSGGGSPGTGGGSSQPRSPSASTSPEASSSPDADPGAAATTPRNGPQERAERDRGREDDPSHQQRERQEKTEQEKNQRATERADDESSAGPVEPAEEDQVATSDPPATDGEGLPAWVAPVAIGALFAVAGVAGYLRRRAS